MYSNNDWRDYELTHHGILGMKWGKLNGPPYPLDAKDHSTSEKKAGWRKSLSNRIEKRREDNKEKVDRGLSDKQKKAIKIGAAAAAGAIAIIGAKKLIDINNEVKAEVAQKAFEEAARIQAEQINAWRESSPLNGGPWARANANAAKALRNLGY